MSAHTPGPWELRITQPTDSLVDKNGKAWTPAWAILFDQNGHRLAEGPLGTMRLLHSAPDLLAALEDILGLAESAVGDQRSPHNRLMGERCRRARAAIAKAKP